VHGDVVRVARAELVEPPAHERARLDAGHEVLRGAAEAEHELARRLGQQQRPARAKTREVDAEAMETGDDLREVPGPQPREAAVVLAPVARAGGRSQHEASRLRVDDLGDVPAEAVVEHPQDLRLVRERVVRAARLLDHEGRPRPRRGEEDAVPPRGVDDGEALLDHLPRLDNAEREEIVRNV
jgi:hypothetical protein